MIAQPRYDAIASWYDDIIGDAGDVRFRELTWPCMARLCGEVAGTRVLDVACGQGLVSRALARLGAAVVGVDLSSEMIARGWAREHAEPLGIVYRVDDATRLNSVTSNSVELAVCHFALMDVPDLEGVYLAVRRVLRGGGRFVIAITHPCFYTPHAGPELDADGNMLSWHSDRYFDEGEWWSDSQGVRGRVGSVHRTLSTYVNSALDAGFMLERIEETAPATAADDDSLLAVHRRIPYALVASWRLSDDWAPRGSSR